jgi:ribosomal protein S18 acetylase RimI-like enzyme
MAVGPVRIREATFDDRFALARIIIDATFSAFHGRVPDACLHWLDVEESAANWGRSIESRPERERLFVAEVAERDVVGLALAGRATDGVIENPEIPARFGREVTSLQISPAWQKKGVGRMLLSRSAAFVIEQGGDNLLVRVLSDNPNVAFYERLGARTIGEQPYDWEGYATSELIMVWDDVKCLL